MALNRLLIANRGEIAIRIARAAAEMETRTVAVYSEDDARSLHTRRADETLALKGSGVPAYLDAAQIVTLALGPPRGRGGENMPQSRRVPHCRGADQPGLSSRRQGKKRPFVDTW